MDKEDKEIYSAYHTMQNKSKISIKLTADERALLDVWMHDEGWDNLSGFIKYRLFGMDKTARKRNAIVKERNAKSVAIILQHHLADLVNQYRFWRFACQKEIEKYSENTSADFLLRAQTIQKTMKILNRRTMDTMYVFFAIATDLKINVKRLLQDSIQTNMFSFFGNTLGEKHVLFTGIALNDPEQKEDEDGNKSIWVTVKTYKESYLQEELCRYYCQLRNTKASVKKGDDVSVYGLFSAPLVKIESGYKTVMLVVTNSIVVKLN